MLLRLSIAFISAAVLGYEVLLTRLLSIIHWHHFAYMIISLALLGFGISGTFLTLTQRWILPRWSKAFVTNAILFGLTIPGSFILVQKIPFNALEIAWDIRQVFYLFAFYLILTIPFFCAANCIGIALARFKEQIHRLYRFDLMGAGLGALGIVVALFLLKPTACLRLLCIYTFIAAILTGLQTIRNLPRLTILILFIVLPLIYPSSWTKLNLSEYKGLNHALRVPDAELIHEDSSPLGLISVVKSETIPFRHAPGLSLNNTQEPPPQLGVFTDGDSMTVITKYDGDRDSLRYLDYMTSALPYHLLKKDLPSNGQCCGCRRASLLLKEQRTKGKEKDPSERVLILGAGAGSDVLLAKYHEIPHIDVVEVNPQMIDLVENTYRDFSGNIYGSEEVKMHTSEARGFIKRSSHQKQQYDLIQVSLLDSFGASSAGLYALNENYLYTTQAFKDYLSILKPDGLLAITRWVKVPPRDSLKLFATAIDALKDIRSSNPVWQLAMIRSWKTSTLLVKNSRFTARDIHSILTFSDERSFDVIYFSGMPPHLANRYNQIAAPYFYEGATSLLGTESERFKNNYKFQISPATDDSPYFFHFLKWKSLPEILSLKKKGGLPLLEWGYPILIVTLFKALVASLVLILLPLWWFRRQALHRLGVGSVFVYFFALGLAFLFIEMAYIQRFILFLSHPLYAIAVVLCGFLVFAGLGSGFSARLANRCGGLDARSRFRAIMVAVAGIVLVSLLYQFRLFSVFDYFLPFSDIIRVILSLILIAPLAFFMGMPFPLGLALIGDKQPDFIPWAWGINGCASVISAILATLLAIHFGFTTVILMALVLYVLAMLSLVGQSKLPKC